MDKTTMSLVDVVEKGVIVNEVPVIHVPDALPSSDGAGRSANSWRERAPAWTEADDANWGVHRYMLELAVREKDPEVPGCAACVSTVKHGAEQPVTGALRFS
jgi:hypothetical protein